MNFQFVSLANPRDQLEPVVKFTWGNILSTCKIPNLVTIKNSQNTSKCDQTLKQYQINWHFYVKAKLVSFSLSWTLLIVIDPTMSVSFFLFLIVKSALWALQGMTIQKMASRDPKQTANQHQRHENSMYVYIYEHMYTCIIITDWKKVITMDSFTNYLMRKMLYINMWKYIWNIF